LASPQPSHPQEPQVAARRLLEEAAALRTAGKDGEAARLEREAVATLGRGPRHRAAAHAIRAGDSFRANQVLKQLLDDDPDDVLAAVMLGLQASRADEPAIADRLLGRAVELAPGDPGARLALADHMLRGRRHAAALGQLEALDLADQAPQGVQLMIADCLGELGRIDEQLKLLGQLRRDGGNPAIDLRVGHALRTLGRFDEAAGAYRAVIAANPAEGTAWHSLANLKTARFTEADVEAMEQALAIPGAPVVNRIRLNFALGKALEDRGDARAAFEHYTAGNRLRAEIAPYDPSKVSDWVERCSRAFTAEFFADRAGLGDPSDAPIFIVGMQRSGSTLVEQILASHPAIEGTAELNDVPSLVRRLGDEAAAAGTTFEAWVANFDGKRLAALGAEYLAGAQAHRTTDKPYFTDKMPNNWMHLALIRLILPNAKVIDVRRDPMDCCVSNWKQLYARGLDHSNALDTMGRYYADYVRLMRHFDRALPGWVHRVIYEDLVEDLEDEVRRALDHLGVEFDPACIGFHATDRAVRTISATQVREPINRKGIGAWRKFEPWLADLNQSLGKTREEWRN
jgi:tetratricopeptide (TPR) repeat protein